MGLLNKLVPTSIKVKVRHRFMEGDAVYCPVCERTGIAFLPSGLPLRPHAQCAFCGSLERARMAWVFLQERKLPRPGMRILHIAPEKCLFDRFRAVPGVEYVAGDKFDPGYKWPEGTIHLDVTDLKFPDGHFDMIICSHVLEHVPDDRKAMNELSRVLKKGGSGLVLSPVREDWETTREDPSVTDPEERFRLYGKFDHVRYYGRDYVDRLKAAGFEVEVVDLSSGMPYEKRFRLGFSDEKLYVVSK